MFVSSLIKLVVFVILFLEGVNDIGLLYVLKTEEILCVFVCMSVYVLRALINQITLLTSQTIRAIFENVEKTINASNSYIIWSVYH